ncbi:hypothetical protein N9072_01415, partial [bacterium]|nr:hypothetical protein [bacterium]
FHSASHRNSRFGSDIRAGAIRRHSWGHLWDYFPTLAPHVLSGNGQLKIVDADGREYRRFGRLEAAEGEDLVRLAIMEVPSHSLELPQKDAVKNGDVIVAYGNSGGGGIINQSEGEVKGVGVNSFEVTGEII